MGKSADLQALRKRILDYLKPWRVKVFLLGGFHAQQAVEKCLIPHAVDMDRYKHEIK